jgi:hypothetical protein
MVLMGSPVVSPPVAKPKALSCPNCGAAVEIRGFAHTLSVVCPNCLSVLDATTPELQILEKFQSKERIKPKIPLGSRGKLGDTMYEVIGFQVREVSSDGESFTWDEYLLFNPYLGFRYITEYNGHWNVVRVLASVPELSRYVTGKKVMKVEGRTYISFDLLSAKTVYVLGEFPWQVHVGDTVQAADYIAPPYMLSSEATENEVTWSEATYTPGAQIFQAFKVPGTPPPTTGVFANQPSPYAGSTGSAWRTWLWLMVALLVAMFLYMVTSSNKEVFSQNYSFAPGGVSQASFVTPEFELKGRDTNVEFQLKTDLRDSWAYFNFALINQDTGNAFDFAREVSYYKNSDESEGSPNNSVRVPSVPSGRYYLRVEPEMDPKGSIIHYELTIRRDAPTYTFFWIAALLLLIPPILMHFRKASFETTRWRESDYGTSSSSSFGGDD